jgi:HSP20 family protein
MAEPQSQSDTDKTAAREATERKPAAPAASGENPKGAEPRTFGDAGAAAQTAAAQTAAAQFGASAPQVAQGGRDLAEAGRRASHNMAQAWSRSVDPLMAFQYDMSRWVDDVWRQMTGLPMQSPLRTARPLGAMGAASLMGLPAADLRETHQAYELAVELPGVAREDVELSLGRDTLSVIGNKSEESEQGAGAYHVSERRYGHFERTFPLPDDVDRAAIKAAFKDGVLKITLPKTESAASRRSKIEIT